MNPAIDYDRIAADYARDRVAIPRVIAEVLRGLAGRSLTDVLEVGCGTADHLCVLSRALKAGGHGFDLSPRMLAEAAAKDPGLDLRSGDASVAYPYPAASFDFVFSVNVIHYIKDLPVYFREALRVLSPGGTVCTVTDSWEDIRRRTMSQYFPATVAEEYARYPDTSAIHRAMADAGFTGLSVTRTEAAWALGPEAVEKYRRRAYSALRLITEEDFQAGLSRLEADLAAGKGEVRELYTYVWGRRPPD